MPRPASAAEIDYESDDIEHKGQREWTTIERHAQYERFQQPEPAQVAHLRAGIAAFRTMLEARYQAAHPDEPSPLPRL
jgi:hypothetical protein